MYKTETITWTTFKAQLMQNPDLCLQFEYADNKWVNAAYHITEIKQAPITAVDCGGVINAWTEIIIQLLEPENARQERAMKVKKAMAIVNLVEKSLPLHPNGIVKIEFGNVEFDTRQMLPYNIEIAGENLIVRLHADSVQCKALYRGDICGIPVTNNSCCAPAEKTNIKLTNLAMPVSKGTAACC